MILLTCSFSCSIRTHFTQIWLEIFYYRMEHFVFKDFCSDLDICGWGWGRGWMNPNDFVDFFALTLRFATKFSFFKTTVQMMNNLDF